MFQSKLATPRLAAAAALVVGLLLTAAVPATPARAEAGDQDGGPLELRAMAWLGAFAESSGADALHAVVLAGDETLLDVGHGGGVERLRAPALAGVCAETLVLRAIDKDELELDATLATLFEDCPESLGPITLEQLLARTSGLPAAAEIWGEDALEAARFDAAEMLAERDFTPLSEPGSCFAPVDTERLLLGWIAARAGSLADRAGGLFAELELDETRLGGADTAPVAARPESLAGVEEEGRAAIDASLTALSTTPQDIARFARALASREIFDGSVFERATRSTVLSDGRAIAHGLLFTLGELDDERRITFGGSGGGASFLAAHYPTAELTVVVAADAELRANPLELGIARALFGLPEPEPADLPLSPDARAVYTGTYAIGCTQLNIVEADERLVLVREGSQDLPLAFQGGELFLGLDDPFVRLRFRREGDETPEGFDLEQHGGSSFARRMSDRKR